MEQKTMTEEGSKMEILPFQKKVASVRKLLERFKPQMALALPRHLNPDRMLRVALTAIQRNPKLLECTQTSLLAAIMQGAQLGLETDGVLGEAHLVPYGKTVQFIPGYKGLMKLARNSREISTIFASEVYLKDTFSFAYGLDPKLDHVPSYEEEAGPIIAFYAVSKLKDGGAQFLVMWKRQVEAIRNKSAGYIAAKKYDKESPWETHFAEMGKKTVIRRLCKLLPSSVELQKAVALDELAEAGVDQNLESFIDITAGDDAPKSKLDALVDSDDKPPPPPPPTGSNPASSLSGTDDEKPVTNPKKTSGLF
jgi:recombination protein RecT